LFGLVIECNDFSGADEGEIKWIKEEKDVFSVIALDVNIDEVSIEPGGSDKCWADFLMRDISNFIKVKIRVIFYNLIVLK